MYFRQDVSGGGKGKTPMYFRQDVSAGGKGKTRTSNSPAARAKGASVSQVLNPKPYILQQ